MWNEEALASTWQAAAPFPHVIIDDVVLPLDIEEEAVQRYEGDIFSFEATAPGQLRAAEEAFGQLAAPFARITGKPVTRAEVRAYAYRPGHYLLPHTDHQEGLERLLAFAYYLPTPELPVGGELELFRCTVTDGEIVATDSAVVIEPRANRLVVFDVSDVSLHQVREVLGGLRLSLAGWFHP
jgi:Rps23 Pro-64 3,4-dihydroxylase Tpa1-like proline 4-hydroxylase